MQQLNDFIDKALAIADYRNLAFENPVPVTIPLGNGETFIVVVSHMEPNNVTLPMNVTWIVADPESVDFKRALRRTSTTESIKYRNSWTQLNTYDEMIAEMQYWDVSAGLSFGEITPPKSGPASSDVRGLFKLNRAYGVEPSSPIVVSDTDSRMSNARPPLPHTHPKLPITLMKGAGGINQYVVKVDTYNSPVAGHILALTEPGAKPGEWLGLWRRPTAADIVYDGPTPVTLNINGPVDDKIDETVPFTFTASVTMSDGETIANINAQWFVIGGGQYGGIGGSSGILTTNDVDQDQIIRVEARWRHPESNILVTSFKDITIVDNTIPINLVSIAITGPAEVVENTVNAYTVSATFDDGNTTGITPTTFTSSNPGAGSFDPLAGTLTIPELTEDQVTTITATYTFNGVTRTAEVTVNARDITVYPQSAVVVGPNSVDENTSVNYVLRVTFTDGVIEDIVSAMWTTNNPAAGSISATTGEFVATTNLFDDETTVLGGEYSLNGRTVTATKQIVVRDTTIYPRSAQILGPITINENSTTQFQFSVTFTDDSTAIVSVTNWAIDNNTIGNINATTGMFVAVENLVGDESGVISASYTADGVTVSATKSLTVRDTTVYPTSARILGNSSMSENATQTMQFEVTYTDGSIQTQTVNNWLSSNPSAASIGQTNGIVLSNPNLQANATTVISASWTENGITVDAQLELTVQDTTNYPVSATIAGPLTVNENSSGTYTLNVTFLDGTTTARPAQSWSVTGAASINTAGVMLAPVNVNENTQVTITATYELDGRSVSATRNVTIIDTTVYPVTARILGPDSLFENTTRQYQFEVTFSDATVSVVTVNNWASTNPAAGTIGASSGSFASAEVNENVTTTISASYTSEGITVGDEKTITVQDGTVYPVSAVIVGPAQLDEGTTATYAFRVTFTDNSQANVPVTNWTSSNTNVGVINPGSGLFTAAANLQADGTTTIAASYTAEGVTVNAERAIQVIDVTAYPVSAVISGPAVIDENTTGTYSMLVTFDDGTSTTVDADSWVTSNPVAGTVDGNGIFTAAANDTDTNISTTLTAVYSLDGVSVTGNRTIAVRDATNYPASIAITGPGSVESAGPDGNRTYQYNMVVTYRDGSTSQRQAATWAVEGTIPSDNVGTISSTGLYTTNKDAGGSNRTIKFTATYSELGKNLSTQRNVTFLVIPLPVGLVVEGPSSVASNSLTTYTSRVLMSDGSSSPVISTWTTVAEPTLATMSAAGNFTTFTANEDTNTTITATYEAFGVEVTQTETITVREVVLLSSISVTGADTINSSGSSQYVVTAAYSDGTTQIVTGATNYSVNNASAGAFDVAIKGRFNAATVTEDVSAILTFSHVHNGVTRNATLNITVLAPVVAGNSNPRYGTAMFSDTDFTGGKDPDGDINYGTPYDSWTGLQDFADSVMTNVLPTTDSGQTISFNIGTAQYGYFMLPKSLADSVTFVDPAVGFPGGMGGITWTPEGEMGATFGPLEVMYDSNDGQGPQPWLIYRTDWDSLGPISFVVTF